MEQRSRTLQLLPASFHPRQFRTYNARFPLCSAQLPVREARRLRSRPPFRLFLLSLNFCPLSSPKGKEDERIPRPWGESRISLRKQSFLLWVETRLFFALPFVSRNAKSFSFNVVEFVFCEEDMSTRGKIVD